MNIKTTIGVVIMATAMGCNAGTSADLAVELLKQAEGFRPYVYKCTAGTSTIGYGFTDKSLTSKGSITKAEADVILRRKVNDLLSFVRKETKGVALTRGQEAAIVSFCYNCGRQAFLDSTMRKRILSGQLEKVPQEFQKWIFVKGVVCNGLRDNRRPLEIRYWNT